MSKISVALATFNEEANIADCLDSVADFADEIVIVDGTSTDRTVEIAKKYTKNITVKDNPPVFHINKQLAIEQAHNPWILQMDADERITKALAREIVMVTDMPEEELEKYENSLPSRKLFMRHQRLIEQRDGRVGDQTGSFNAFFIPRRNFFLGKYLKYGGTFPDPAIRLIRRGKAYLPAKDVHEQMVVEGRVGWLQHYMLHIDSPNFKRYLERNDRYINLIVKEMSDEKMSKNLGNFLNYFLVKPLVWFLMTQLRYKGALDGIQGIVFSFFSALRFPRAYFRYLQT